MFENAKEQKGEPDFFVVFKLKYSIRACKFKLG